jgi:hypothetical protein
MEKGKRRMFSCIVCETGPDGPYVAERYRVVEHIYKQHFAISETPFHCKLCQFRCTTKDALDKHVTCYKRHLLAAITTKGGVDLNRCLVVNPSPRPILDGVNIREVTSRSGNESLANDDNVDVGELPSSQTSNLISIQLTPEQLTAFLNQQQKGPEPILEYDPQRPAMTRPLVPTLAPVAKKMTSSTTTSSAFSCVPPRQIPEYTATARSSLSNATNLLYTPVSFDDNQHFSSLYHQPDPPVRPSYTDASSRLNTPVLPDHGKTHRSSPASIVEDITSQLLGSDPLASLCFSPNPTAAKTTMDQGIQTDEAPMPQLTEVVIKTMAESNKAMVDAITKIATMVESNARAVRCLEATMAKFLPHVDKMARAQDKQAEETRRANRRAEDQENVAKRPKLDDKENIKSPEMKKIKNVENKLNKK